MPRLQANLVHPLRAGTAYWVPYLRGTRYGTQNSAAELRNVPRAHLATGQAQAVPIYRPGTQEYRTINAYFDLLVSCYYLLLRISDLPQKMHAQSGLSMRFLG